MNAVTTNIVSDPLPSVVAGFCGVRDMGRRDYRERRVELLVGRQVVLPLDALDRLLDLGVRRQHARPAGVGHKIDFSNSQGRSLPGEGHGHCFRRLDHPVLPWHDRHHRRGVRHGRRGVAPDRSPAADRLKTLLGRG